MFSPIYCVLLWIFPVLYYSGSSALDMQPYLTLYTPGDPDYTDILVRRVGDNLTLLCELKGDATPRIYVWNYLPSDNSSELDRTFATEPRGPALGSRLTKQNLSLSDSGHVVCSAPPYSVTKFILVQTRGPNQCARSAFWCGKHCVLSSYVCDGFKDCVHGEDEAPELCMTQPCDRADKLNCSSGRCVAAAACCAPPSPPALCRQPACCDEHPRYSRLEGYVEVEYPPLFEDRRAPDEFGFIQSTIYTVTACALIFMIAVVLLVSAICKMHMKRAALRSYSSAARHYDARYQQTHRFPPCYEASRLLEQERNISPSQSAPASPARPAQCPSECPPTSEGDPTPGRGFPLAALSAIFTQRYRQIPTQCLDVEMTDVRSSSCHTSPIRTQNVPLDHYRSPTYCDLNTELFLNQEISNCGRELNYMSIRNLRNSPLERVIDRINRPRPITLQLGRFQLSIPRLGRRQSLDRRPDTPNIAELNIDDLDFVRLNSNDTYTLNGRTIRLLGANFENYPVLDDSVRPPPYTDAMRYKLYGPPPEYLSRDCLTERPESTVVTEAQARSNIEMPPCYEDLTSANVAVVAEQNGNVSSDGNNDAGNNGNIQNTSDVGNCGENTANDGQNTDNDGQNNSNTQQNNGNTDTTNQNTTNANTTTQNNGNQQSNLTNNEENNANLKSVIDNLPAIDSDVNANDCDVTGRYFNAANNNEC